MCPVTLDRRCAIPISRDSYAPVRHLGTDTLGKLSCKHNYHANSLILQRLVRGPSYVGLDKPSHERSCAQCSGTNRSPTSPRLHVATPRFTHRLTLPNSPFALLLVSSRRHSALTLCSCNTRGILPFQVNSMLCNYAYELCRCEKLISSRPCIKLEYIPTPSMFDK